MAIKYPDYSNSLVNLSCSILKYFGVQDIKHSTLECADEILNKQKPKNVVIMLFDAMGINILKKHLPNDSFTRTHIVKTISSTFPPTTVAATTAVNSGLTPIESGWLGWITYYKEVDKNVVTFFNTIQDTEIPAAEESLTYSAIPYKTLSQQITEANPQTDCTIVAPFKLNIWDNQVISESIDNSCNAILEITKDKSKNHFIYSYWADPDHIMHEVGIDAESVTPVLQEIDQNLEKLSTSLNDDTVVFVIADHSQINSKWVFLNDYPDLYELLVRKPSMESRAASIFVKPGMCDKFKELFNKYIGQHFLLLDHDQFLKSGLLGSGIPHPRTDDFVGDFVAIAIDEYCICAERTDDLMVGIHAGLTEEEMEIPLIVL